MSRCAGPPHIQIWITALALAWLARRRAADAARPSNVSRAAPAERRAPQRPRARERFAAIELRRSLALHGLNAGTETPRC